LEESILGQEGLKRSMEGLRGFLAGKDGAALNIIFELIKIILTIELKFNRLISYHKLDSKRIEK